MKTYLLLLAFLPAASSAQTIIFEEADNFCTNAGTMTLTYSMSGGGAPARNIYLGHNNNGDGLLQVVWANDQWEIQWDTDGDGSTELLMYYSTFASYPNPPNLSVGNWTEGGNGCGDLTNFSGSGTQSSIALPVELAAFDARLKNPGVSLIWQTVLEYNNAGFHVERSTGDEWHWQTLGFVEGSGTSFGPRHYSFSDEKPLPGTNYYRLRQADFDGSFDYSPIRSVTMGREPRSIDIYPNPAYGNAAFSMETDQAEEGVLRLYDALGKQVLLRTLTFEEGAYRNNLDLTGLAEGVYTVSVRAGHEHWQGRVVIK